MQPGDHRSVAYSDEAELEPVLAPFIAEGLAGADKVLYLTDVTHPAVVTGLLRGWGVDTAGAVASGRLDIRRLEAFDPGAMVADVAAEAEQARSEGYRALRVTGEMSWAVRVGTDRLAEFEAGIQRVYDTGAALGVCQFDKRLFAPGLLADLLRHHRADDGDLLLETALLRIRRTFAPDGIQVEGEIDATSAADLARQLSEATGVVPGDLHVDLHGVTFIDLAGLRALVDTAKSLGDQRELVLGPVPDHVNHLMRLIGWHTAPGLRIDF
ncbi:STAS domain-containing protein [Herbidospora sp. NEAU-GS84]|uniref:STAS domain-containing protein n=1 Tax=Herbidospora solisilvae TaxID=2696284 RepID=A0A7C9NEQ2_9ACTN|nr:MEDS domain-containing protein [Herbidospora solisilvae]NAS21058.1 STAS domain-containing protein [Herbidospora solisilvae]